MFEHNTPYDEDKQLLADLGFELFNLPLSKKHCLGKHTFEDGSWMQLWVTCLPAQFFAAKIYCADNDTIFNVDTGSGTFKKYWEFFRMIVDGMIVIR